MVYYRNGVQCPKISNKRSRFFIMHRKRYNLIVHYFIYSRWLTFKDLEKKVSGLEATRRDHKILELLHDKPFWLWNTEKHKQEDINTKGQCCFNHIVSCPTKNGQEKAMFDYEKLLYYSLLDNLLDVLCI